MLPKLAVFGGGYLQSIYRNPAEPESRRIRAAIEALPFEKSSHERRCGGLFDRDTFAERLERATARSNGARLIEAKAIEVSPTNIED